jgi:hypothetical protein
MLNDQYIAFLFTSLQTVIYAGCHNLINLQVHQAKNKTKATTVHVLFQQLEKIDLCVEGNVMTNYTC